ncbi:tetratricopeptide repeat protein [Nocardia abscessus]|uniref:tetratricopeptide repeat protein n=1 Tax=Nocardia abscessus TaxID=120957 RepID=UPI0024584BA9|nr:hypothetical protein [Nocardia abscessus]
MHLRTAIESAERRYNELLEQGRFDQAAAALNAVLESAAEVNGADSLAVLRLRSLVAAAWSLGGEHGKAKREFEALAEAYRRVQGRFSEFAWDSRASAARCRIALGDTDGGIAALRSVLDEVVAANSDGGEMALALSFDIGEMLASTGQFAEARTLLAALHKISASSTGSRTNSRWKSRSSCEPCRRKIRSDRSLPAGGGHGSR